MSKVKLGAGCALYPSLSTIVGAMVDGKPNFMAVAHVGIMNHGTPQYISVSLNKHRYTAKGVEEHGQFSVCLPSCAMAEKADYVGVVSGKNTDKSQVFDVFTGDLEFAPLIRECPVCMGCRVDRTMDFNTHTVYVGEIVQTHADAEVTADGKIDLKKADPLLFHFTGGKYWSLGEPVADCWSAGKALKHKLEQDGEM